MLSLFINIGNKKPDYGMKILREVLKVLKPENAST